MSTFTKVIVTIGILVVFWFFFVLIVYNQKINGNSTPGLLGLIIFSGFIAAMKAVWKKNPSNQDSDKHQLDKRN